MDKSVLISIRPEWCELIASGEKTIEVRKTRPKLQTPFKCYIYCTKDKHLAFMQNASGTNLIACMNAETAIPVGGFLGNGKVIGEFTCDAITRVNICGFRDDSGKQLDNRLKETCLTSEELCNYLGENVGYGWRICDLVIYDAPHELDSFRRVCPEELDCESCAMHSENTGHCGNEALYLRRAPQSWCYVEEG
jgi:predicted transcriptional regulator